MVEFAFSYRDLPFRYRLLVLAKSPAHLSFCRYHILYAHPSALGYLTINSVLKHHLLPPTNTHPPPAHFQSLPILWCLQRLPKRFYCSQQRPHKRKSNIILKVSKIQPYSQVTHWNLGRIRLWFNSSFWGTYSSHLFCFFCGFPFFALHRQLPGPPANRAAFRTPDRELYKGLHCRGRRGLYSSTDKHILVYLTVPRLLVGFYFTHLIKSFRNIYEVLQYSNTMLMYQSLDKV